MYFLLNYTIYVKKLKKHFLKRTQKIKQSGFWKNNKSKIYLLFLGYIFLAVMTPVVYLLIPVRESNVLAGNTVNVNPGDNIQTIVNANPAASTYILKAGIHRMQKVTPKAGDTFIGEFGAILNGSKVLTGWTQSGATWYVTGQTQETAPYPPSDPWTTGGNTFQICDTGYGRCRYNEELFFTDGSGNITRLKHETSLTNVETGEWFFDYSTDRIYVGSNPASNTVETSVTDAFINSSIDNIKVSNLIIEKYASPVNYSTLQLTGNNAIVEYNEFRYNHSDGVRADDNGVVRNNYIHHNGYSGLAGQGDNTLIENNEISYNNETKFYYNWSGGGNKFVKTDGLILRNNYSHHNYGSGLWTDINNINCLIENNILAHNDKSGIHHEIGYDCIIRNNFSGYNSPGRGYSQIHNANSKNVQIYGNTIVISSTNGNGIFVQNESRGGSTSGLDGISWLSTNVQVSGNSIYNTADRGFVSGLAGPSGTSGTSTFAHSAQSVTFNNNDYFVPNSSSTRWTWGPYWTYYSFNNYKTQGLEATGSVTTTGYTIPSVPAWNVTRGPQASIGIGTGVCGDGTIQTPNSTGTNEQCDDNDTTGGDGCSSVCQTEAQDPGVGGWTYRKNITLNEAQVSGTSAHANFPMYIDITDSNLQANAQNDADDVYFTLNDGTTKLAHEIVSYNSSNGQVKAWIKIPSLSATSNTTIYMYYGNPSAANQENIGNVWSEYKGVWHLEENPAATAPQILDSTSNDNKGTSNGSMVSGNSGVGKLGNALTFDGTNDSISMGDPSNGSLDVGASEDFTLQGWVKTTHTTSGIQILAKGASGGATGDGYKIYLNAPTSGRIGYRLDGALGGAVESTPGNSYSGVNNGSWRFVTVTFDRDGSSVIYIDGISRVTTSISSVGNESLANANNFYIGRIDGGQYWNGSLDEIKVVNTLRNSDWISTEYNNQNNPAAFATFGTQELVNPSSCGDGTVNTPNGSGVTEACDDENTEDLDHCSASCTTYCVPPQIWSGTACFNPTLTESGADYFLFEAENFVAGGEGSAYHDLTPGNSGGDYRYGDVDIKNIGTNEYATGWNETGEWAKYFVTVPSSGNYNITVKAASGETGGGILRFDVENTPYLTVNIPSTGSYNTYSDITAVGGNIDAGTKTITLNILDQWVDIDYVRFDKAVANCGDGTVNGTEQCDIGVNNGTACSPSYGSSCNYCSLSCTTITVQGANCGDDLVNGSEQCDDGADNGDVCTAAYGGSCNYCNNSCQTVTIQGTSCGDSTIQSGNGETCDAGGSNGVVCSPAYGSSCNYCNSSCNTVTLQGTRCGDGTTQGGDGEQCDSGVNNGTVCTPPNGGSCNYCNNSCQTITLNGAQCGDGTIQSGNGEICDAGVNNGVVCSPSYGGSCNYCNNSCQTITLQGAGCGDSTVNGTEECDSGVNNGSVCSAPYGGTCNYCDGSCEVATIQGSYCGDSSIQSSGGENCDTGPDNGLQCSAGYGSSCNYCSNACQNTVVQGPSCGDGTIQSGNGEQCDNASSNGVNCSAAYGGSCNYCNSSCQTVSVQGASCGDGTIQSSNGEQCDNGGSNGNVCTAGYEGVCNYCNNSCQTTTLTGASCGDGITQTVNGETCDDGVENGDVCAAGNEVSCDYCSNTCQTTTVQGGTCGNGTLDRAQGEQCDDSNTSNGDGCNSNCVYEIANPTTQSYCGYIDKNSDGKLTLIDFSFFLQSYGKTCVDPNPTDGCRGKDANGDGRVSLVDFLSLVLRYGNNSCSI